MIDDLDIPLPEQVGNRVGVVKPNRVFDFSKTLGPEDYGNSVQ